MENEFVIKKWELLPDAGFMIYIRGSSPLRYASIIFPLKMAEAVSVAYLVS